MKIPKADWKRLATLSRMKAVSSMYIWLFIVPICSKLMSKTEDFVQLTAFNHTFSIDLSLPFSWQWFYFSALFFAAAILTFKLRCPRIIQEHPTFSSFQDEGKPEWQLAQYTEEIGISFNDYKDKHLRSKHAYSRIEHHPAEEPETITDKQNLFWHLHREAEKCRRSQYWLCVAFYAAGFLCLSIVFIENVIWVLSDMGFY